jgi:hypothetical protein
METLVFGVIASYNAHRRRERVVAEPQEFPPFDLQALRNPGENMPSRALLGWAPKVDLEKGIRLAINYFQSARFTKPASKKA